MAGKKSDTKSSIVSKSGTKKTNSKTKSTSRSKVKKEVKTDNVNETDVTTRIRIDDLRINDVDSLDTSFLEGKGKKKINNNPSNAKKKILTENNSKIDFENIFKIALLVIVSVVLLVFMCFFIKNNALKKTSKKAAVKDDTVVTKKADSKEIVNDRNYLFVGDMFTDEFPFEEFELDYHYVKSSDKKMTTESLLEGLESDVYIYNPSIVFLSIGFNDLNGNLSVDDYIENMTNIVEEIRNNRSYAKIYIESLYPINTNIDGFDEELISENFSNDLIIKCNKKLMTLSKKLNVEYLDVYSMIESKGKLDGDYTDDGINLNEDGYRQVLKLVNKVID